MSKKPMMTMILKTPFEVLTIIMICSLMMMMMMRRRRRMIMIAWNTDAWQFTHWPYKEIRFGSSANPESNDFRQYYLPEQAPWDAVLPHFFLSSSEPFRHETELFCDQLMQQKWTKTDLTDECSMECGAGSSLCTAELQARTWSMTCQPAENKE